jgi:hypothetical protein
MKVSLFASALALTGLVAGCAGDGRLVVGHSDSVPFKQPPEMESVRHEPATPFGIEVLDVSAVTRPYIVMGLAEAETTTLHEAVDRLRREASKIGGDAILDILPCPGGNTTMALPIFGDMSFRSGRIWTARVIRWVPDGMTLKQAPNPK